ncbi:hypothetical protein A8C32_16670 [Flavivirga aquatica]|uniref:FAS1 domain-containing protein n=1 Tax=Flavivirga aquatica TaxID=1849968 RepID=A0A1E5T8S6_9FLAO|nr:fasciclin domain-containing protein [Flavivirga aquatica]OEK07738.1 hypothetical protein A8C32_16670 [Flavivirga aquatica]
MKTLDYLKRLTLAFATVLLLFSCNNDDDDNIQRATQTIAELASNTPNLSKLVSALQRANLVTTLDGSQQFTVFAPTNDAFDTFLSANNFASIDDVPIDILTQVLLNHVIDGEFPSSNIFTGYGKTLATYSNTNLNLSLYLNTTSGLTINGTSSVVTPNVDATNGIIHIVNAVIDIPTIVTFATADPNFSTLVNALTTLTPGTNFAEILSRTTGGNNDNINPPFTVFAPLNSAFDALSAIPAEPELTQILLHHVVSGNISSGNLIPNDDTNASSLHGDNLTITLPGIGNNVAGLTDGSGNSDIGIVFVDVQASNGIIHIINKVATPSSP